MYMPRPTQTEQLHNENIDTFAVSGYCLKIFLFDMNRLDKNAIFCYFNVEIHNLPCLRRKQR